jgi:ABC-type antimicrobial peptide transport system permease subunit
VDPEWWTFGLSGLGAIVIATLSVGYQSIRAARQNPVKSLRTE